MNYLILTCGIPGSGKTTFIKNNFTQPNAYHISRDKIRFSLIKDGDEYFSKEKLVYQTFVSEIQKLINDENDNIIIADATHINEVSRSKLLNSLVLTDTKVCCFNFLTSCHTCLERNEKRVGREKVPAEVIKRMNIQFFPADQHESYRYMMIYNINEGEDTLWVKFL